MDEEIFLKKRQEMVKEIPMEFHSFLFSYSWEHGHSCGYDEVLNVLSDLVYSLKDAIEKYNKNKEK